MENIAVNARPASGKKLTHYALWLVFAFLFAVILTPASFPAVLGKLSLLFPFVGFALAYTA